MREATVEDDIGGPEDIRDDKGDKAHDPEAAGDDAAIGNDPGDKVNDPEAAGDVDILMSLLPLGRWGS